MRIEKQFYLHDFDSLNDMTFKAEDYSKLKFGSDSVAKKYGHALAEAFFNLNYYAIVNQRLVVIPSPYNHVKNAATVMSEHFVNKLNELLINSDNPPVEWDTIHRKVSYISDYGFLDAKARKSLIDNDTFYLNQQFWEGKKLIFIDDVFITGTHEVKLREILDNAGVKNDTFYLYFAKYMHGEVGANIEASLNFAYVTDPSKFIKLTKQKGHHLIVRPIKYLLSLPAEEFKIVLSQLPATYVEQLYYGALAEGYSMKPAYVDNMAFVAQLRGGF